MGDVEVFGVVDVAVGASLDAVDHAGFEVEEDCAGDIPSVVGLGRSLAESPLSHGRSWMDGVRTW